MSDTRERAEKLLEALYDRGILDGQRAGEHVLDNILDAPEATELLALIGDGEPVAGPWKLWDGWGPHTDGLMRVMHIGPIDGGLRAYDSDGLSPVDIQGTREDLELVVNAVTAHLHPQPVEPQEPVAEVDSYILIGNKPHTAMVFWLTETIVPKGTKLYLKPQQPTLHERDSDGNWICCCGDHLEEREPGEEEHDWWKQYTKVSEEARQELRLAPTPIEITSFTPVVVQVVVNGLSGILLSGTAPADAIIFSKFII